METETNKSAIIKILIALGISFILVSIGTALQPQSLLEEVMKLKRHAFSTTVSLFIAIIAASLVVAFIVAIAQLLRKQPWRNATTYSFRFTNILLSTAMLCLFGYNRWKFDPSKRERAIVEYNEELNRKVNEIDVQNRERENKQYRAEDYFGRTTNIQKSKTEIIGQLSFSIPEKVELKKTNHTQERLNGTDVSKYVAAEFKNVEGIMHRIDYVEYTGELDNANFDLLENYVNQGIDKFVQMGGIRKDFKVLDITISDRKAKKILGRIANSNQSAYISSTILLSGQTAYTIQVIAMDKGINSEQQFKQADKKFTKSLQLNYMSGSSLRSEQKLASEIKNKENVGYGISIVLPHSWNADTKKIMAKKLELIKELGKVEKNKIRLLNASPKDPLYKPHGLIRIGVMNKPSLSQTELTQMTQTKLTDYLVDQNVALIANKSMGINKSSIDIRKTKVGGFNATQFTYQRDGIMGSGLRQVSLYEIPFEKKRIYITTSYSVKQKAILGAVLNQMLDSVLIDTSYRKKNVKSVKKLSKEPLKLSKRVASKQNSSEKATTSVSEKRLAELEKKMALMVKENESLKAKVKKIDKEQETPTIQKVKDSEKWKIIANWRKLKKDISKETALSILGQPTKAGEHFWYYGEGYGSGRLMFMSDGLYDWTEPSSK